MPSQPMVVMRHDAATLRAMAQAMLERVGLSSDRAADVADILVEGDLMGHDTHGLQLLPTYLAEIESGSMAVEGDFDVLADRAAVATWDGKRLPGPWLTLRAMDSAMARARDYGTGTVTIRRAHHIGCLAAYLERAAQAGFVILLYSSAPAAQSVAPFGGTHPLFSPSPMAAGFPTPQGPVLIDVSTSITTVGMTTRLYKQGKRLPHPWLIDEHGNASNDPAVLFAPHAGSILPLGGLDAGHKGYALSLMVEALTAGLSGHGRDDPGKNWGNTVFLQILDPSAFAGEEAFAEQMGWIARACTDNPPRPGVDRVRLPGQGALERKARQLRDGVALNPAILSQLQPWLEKFGMTVPAALT
ncbi:Ldh family oxidoreductase [Pantoea sp. 18069]|uniref:Ldh family oxidoreductase n=1 Tax=Pantoea sp. 18069 TaxID=2681415 RepID=UPI00190F3324|nr:Ldh family oxidoreductase [Pantoea sp. 18069]